MQVMKKTIQLTCILRALSRGLIGSYALQLIPDLFTAHPRNVLAETETNRHDSFCLKTACVSAALSGTNHRYGPSVQSLLAELSLRAPHRIDQPGRPRATTGIAGSRVDAIVPSSRLAAA